MTAPRWTPGRWSVSNGHLLRVTDIKATPVVICGVHRIGSKGGVSRGDALANARLIAAAPALYEALADILNADGRWRDYIADEPVDRACAALAKARGETP